MQLRNHPLLAPDVGLDTTAYAHLAQQVVAGDVSLGPGLYYVSPLYIYFLAACLAVLKTFTAVRVVQVLLGTAAAGAIFLMTREWFGERAAWCALACAALTGLFTFFEVLILQSSIDVCLTAMALCGLTFALTRGKAALFVASGIVFGLMTLNRPNVLLAAAGILVVLAAQRRVRPAALLLTGVLVGLAPAVVRNAVVAHQVTFASSHGGLNFYIGNSATATGFYHEVPGITPTIGGQETDTIRVASQALGHPVTAADASGYFFGLARDWMIEHPAAALGLFARKVYYVFNAQFISLGQSYPFFAHEQSSLLRFLFIGPWLLIPLGLVGLLAVRRAPAAAAVPAAAGRRRNHITVELADRRAYVVWLSFVPAYVVGIAVFFMAERYRLPLLVPMTVGAGAAIDMVLLAVRSRRLTTIAVPAALFGALAVAANWPLGASDGRWEEGLRLADRLTMLGRDDEAAAAAAAIRANEPRPGATDAGVGAQLLQLDHPDRALPYLQRAHDANPADLSTEYALGQALLTAGRVNDAIPHLRRGFESGLPLPQGGLDYAQALKEAGDVAGAATALRRVTPGDDPEAWLRAGRLAVELHTPDAAEAFFRRAVRMRPDAGSRQQLGVDLMLLGKYEEAAAELSEASRLDPHDAGTLSHLAYCEAKLSRLDAARAHVQQALALDPGDTLARQLAAALR